MRISAKCCEIWGRWCAAWALGLLGVALTAGMAEAQTMLPAPKQVRVDTGFLRIHNGLRVHHQGPEDAVTRTVLQRFTERLSAKAGIRFPAPWAEQGETALLRTYTQEAAPRYPQLGMDESYTLKVGSEAVELRAGNAYGLRLGLETLLQLLETRGEGQGFAAVEVVDAPRFAWRGLMLDPVRHFLPLALVKRQVDAMAMLKLNVLHLRLSDDQGFRMESKRYPRLHQMGAEGQFYTQDELRDLVEYAGRQGIRVVPEFAVPSHTASWLVGYPELSARPGAQTLVRSFGVFQPVMDPTKEELYPFLAGFFAEVAGIFPDRYLHIGGDEVTGKHWMENPSIRQYMQERGYATPEALHFAFNQRLLPILEGLGKRVIGWDEVLHPDLPKTVTVQSWRGQKALADSVRRGYAGILSNGYYLDLMLSAETHHRMDPLGGEAGALSPEEAKRVLGGEMCAWAEFMTAENLELKLWPRAAAIAERFWSDPQRTSAEAYYERVPWLLRELAWLDVSPEQVRRRMMARAMPSGGDIGAMEGVLALLEPVKWYHRADSGDYTVFRPLNRLVDLLWPESMEARDLQAFCLRVRGGTGDAAAAQLQGRMERWRADYLAAAPLFGRSALLGDGAVVAQEVDATLALGLEALNWIARGVKPPAAWSSTARERLKGYQEQKREVLNKALDPVQFLVEKASASGNQ